MDHEDDKIHNPVEEYMKEIMDLDKPDKPPETTPGPTRKLEIKGVTSGQPVSNYSNKSDAVKVADTLRQALSIRKAKKKTLETQIFNTGRHPIGLVYLCVLVVVSYAAIFSLISYLLPGFADVAGVELSTLSPIVGSLMIATAVAGVISLITTSRSYLQNRLMLTDKGLTLVSRTGRLDKEALQLPLEEIESFIMHQNSVFSRIFNYGTIVIETSKGHDDVLFKYLPNPSSYFKAIQDTRLEYLADYRTTRL